MLVPTAMTASRPALATALDDYVAAPDEHYAYRLVETRESERGTVHILHMASQVWRSGRDVHRILWRHWLAIAVPDRVEHDTAFLLIGGGDNDLSPPEKPSELIISTALATNSVTAQLWNVPNQPLVFLADPDLKKRTEDRLLAFAASRFVEDGDPTWLPHLAMVKAAVRAMDTVTSFCRDLDRDLPDVQRFVVGGASKRGWTAWLTAAVDERVAAVVPAVIDCLNLKPSFEHHHRIYGRYADAVRPYVDNRILEAMDTPRMREACAIIDPYAYRDRLTMPKLILTSAGDQFFLPDSWQFYWDGLPGPKWLRTAPNTDHGLSGADVEHTVRAFYAAVLAGRGLPQFDWVVEKDTGVIRVKPKEKPQAVMLWSVTNPDARDFQLQTTGPAWQATPLPEQAGGVYVAAPPRPERGWTAFLVELSWPDPLREDVPLKLTTGVSVIPP